MPKNDSLNHKAFRDSSSKLKISDDNEKHSDFVVKTFNQLNDPNVERRNVTKYDFSPISSTMTPKEARKYLVQLGTHNADGSISKNYCP